MGRQDFETETLIAHSLRADGFDASEDGRSHANAGVMPAVAFNLRGREGGSMPECDDLASIRSASGGSSRSYVSIRWSEELTASEEVAGTIQYGGQGGRHDGVMTPQMAVRRLTPEECEALQGFPRGYTKIDARTADGSRYKALGNSMAVPVMRWIGERIQMVEDINSSK